MSLQDGTSKMSKSAESDLSRINLLDPPDLIVQKVKVGGACVGACGIGLKHHFCCGVPGKEHPAPAVLRTLLYKLPRCAIARQDGRV